MNLIDIDRLRKELMAKGDIPIHEVFNTIWDQPIVNICEVKEQQPCEDCISRKALIERINNAEENFKADNMESIATGDEDPFVDGVLSGVFNIRAMVQQAPSVTPQQARWIPVSEKNPDKRGFYLVSTTDCITIMEFVNGWISQNIGLCNFYVKAWMPLPEPYEEIKNA